MRHVALDQSFTLARGFSVYDGGRRAEIPGTYRTAKMGRRDRTHGHYIREIGVIELPHVGPSWAPRARIPYLCIF